MAAVETHDALTSTKRKLDDQPDFHPSKRPGHSHTKYPKTSTLARDVIQMYFGLQAFRLEQESVIARLLAGGSAVVVFPTGGVKSLCYQVCACIRL